MKLIRNTKREIFTKKKLLHVSENNGGYEKRHLYAKEYVSQD
jgi:hypothetical protein